MDDGDLLVSFRHFSSVFKIATSDRPGFVAGDVVWKLGGRDSDFTFPPGEGGPCAQHTARQLPNGNILMFDNGSWNVQPLCVDPTNPAGPPIQRLQTRVVEFELDEQAGTATVLEHYAPPGWFALFAGSSEMQPNGNTLIGWASETRAVASEVDAGGNLLWEIKDPSAAFPYFTYRAAKATVPDAIDPSVTVSVPAEGASYVEGTAVAASFECSDRGGSSLQQCQGPSTLDTSRVGTHTVAVTASDGAGRTGTVTRTYQVVAASGVDAAIQKTGSRRWIGEETVGSAKAQRATSKLGPGDRAAVSVRLRNGGAVPTSIDIEVRDRGRGFRVRPAGSSDLTTMVLQPGQTWVLRLTVVRRPSARQGDHVVVTVTGVAQQPPLRADGVSWKVTATS
jgi:hypothetical protein